MKEYKEYLFSLTNMYLIIDERETQLYDVCKTLIGEDNPNITMVKEVLVLGDASIKMTKESPDLVILERKSIRDLLASIKDGRYEEQSHRLTHSSNIPLHNIVYLIEGMYSQTRTAQEKQTVLSAMTSLNLLKGFSVIRTCSLNETADTIIAITTKLDREFKKGKQLAYTGASSGIALSSSLSTQESDTPSLLNSPFLENTQENSTKRYSEVVKKVKKENITPQNVGEIILSQIPGISSTTAIAVMSHFTSFSDFMEKIREHPEMLKNMQYKDSSGKTRKISSTILKNIGIYLLGLGTGTELGTDMATTTATEES